MAFPVNDRRTDLVGAANQSLFTYDFYLETEDDLTITHSADATGVVTSLVLNTDYTVDADDLKNTNGGDITLTTTGFLPSGTAVDDLIVIEGTRDIRIDDPEFVLKGPFKAESINAVLRIKTLEIQEANRKADRAISLATTAGTGVSPVLPIPIALQGLRWDAAGLALENYVTDAFPTVHADETLVRMDGVNTGTVQSSGITVDNSDNLAGIGTIASGSVTVTGNIAVSGLVDGRDVATDGAVLDLIEPSATADQTDVEIKTAYENNADTNEFSDAEQTKLTNIELLADVTDVTNVNAAGAAMNTDWNANTILVANADDTPLALTIAASRILGRKLSGNIGALTAAEIRTILQDPVSLQYALSDETTDLIAGTARLTTRMPFAMTLTDVRISVNTAPTGANINVDVNESGATILSTKVSIDATEKTSTTASTAVVISNAALADDAELIFDLDQIGSIIAGKGLKIRLIGFKT